MTNSPLSPSELSYASLLDYSPRGTSPIAIRSRQFIRDGVKNDRPGIIANAIEVLEEHAFGTLGEFFGPEKVLVPVPRSSPLLKDGLWPSLRICEEIENRGLARVTYCGLRRLTRVQQACMASPGQRPTPEDHVDSMSVNGSNTLPYQFLLVDDFVTRGSILTACAYQLRQAFPNATVQAFALINTEGIRSEIQRLVEPRTGIIKYENGKLQRDPWRRRLASESAQQDELQHSPLLRSK